MIAALTVEGKNCTSLNFDSAACSAIYLLSLRGYIYNFIEIRFSKALSSAT